MSVGLTKDTREEFMRVVVNDDLGLFKELVRKYGFPKSIVFLLVFYHEKKKNKIIEFFLNHKKTRKEMKNDLLNRAVDENKFEIIKLAIENGANPNNSGGFPLCFSCMKADIEVVEFLLNNGASVHTENEYGGTPLMFASNTSRKDFVRLLVSRGADINKYSKDLKEDRERTVYDGLIKYRNIEMIDWYLDYFHDKIDQEQKTKLEAFRLKSIFKERK